MAQEEKNTILLIDSNALIHRAFHAFPKELTTADGEPINAAYGFTALLLQVLNKFKPKYVVCLFDTSKKTFRNDLYEPYKANRPDTDLRLVSQFSKVEEIVRALNIPVLKKDGYEADDLIGTLSKSKSLKSIEKIIVTGDRDLLQLIDQETFVYLPAGSFTNSILYNEASVVGKLGFEAKYLTDFKGLRGDTSDNIPGVPGVGDKTATSLIQQYGTLEKLYASLSELKGAIKLKLEQNKELALLSRQLATIVKDVDLDFQLEESELDDYDQQQTIELFKKYQFKSLLSKLPSSRNSQNITSIQEQKLTSEFKTNLSASGKEVLDFLKNHDNIAIRTYTTEDLFQKFKFGMAGEGIIIACDWTELGENERGEIRTYLEKKTLIGHDVKALLYSLQAVGMDNLHFNFDVMLAAYVVNGGSGKMDLSGLAFNHLGIVLKEEGRMDDSLLAEELKSIFLLSQFFSDKLSKDNNKLANGWSLTKVFSELEMPLIYSLMEMEKNGINLDVDYLSNFSQELDSLIAEKQKQIFAEVGHEFNIASPKQLGEVLFGELNLPGGKKNKNGGFSTNERVLSKFSVSHPVVANVLAFRELSKLRSTYTDALIKQVNKSSGRIHTTFNQAVAATGRLSSTNPNMQNIPTSTDLGLRIKQAFVAEKGKLLISFDYSQQELRLLAHFSGEEKLKEAFNSNIDIHALTASQIFAKDVEDIDKNERRIGKTVNFGVVYGMGAFGLSDRLNIPRQQADQFIKVFFESYPRVKIYFDELIDTAKSLGYIETILGRRKYAPGLKSAGFMQRAAIERELINFPLQGSAADMMKLAMLKSRELISSKYENFARMVLMIHDELVFEVSTTSLGNHQLESFIKDMSEDMKSIIKLDVPVEVSAEYGHNLGQMQELILK